MDADLGCGLVCPLNASIALKPMAALMRSAGERVVVGVKKMKRWGMCTLSDVLQDVKDELHHYRLIVSLAPPAVNDGDQRAVQGVEVLSWEGLPIAPGHISHLKLQNKPLISFKIVTPRSLCYKLYNYALRKSYVICSAHQSETNMNFTVKRSQIIFQ